MLELADRDRFDAAGGERLAQLRLVLVVAERDDAQIFYPVHRNPNVLGPVTSKLGGLSNVFLIEPLDYPRFVDLMRRAYLIVTDSGGIQEEAPSLGKPVLVMREVTERPEALASGMVKLIGTDPELMRREVDVLLDDPEVYAGRAKPIFPYGDGTAARKIVDAIEGLEVA